MDVLNEQRAKRNNFGGGWQNKSSNGGGGSRTGVNKVSFKKNFGGPGSQVNWKGRNNNPSKRSQSVGRFQGVK